jgi:Uma2 family endonuclease
LASEDLRVAHTAGEEKSVEALTENVVVMPEDGCGYRRQSQGDILVNSPKPEKISLAEFLAWEQKQDERFEWIDGVVIHCAGGSDEHAAIISNINAAFHGAAGTGPCFVRGSDRKLVPKNAAGESLGSFYADTFVSCTASDRLGAAAHFPKIVVEVLSPHIGAEFTQKKDAYLASSELSDYYIVDSTRQCVFRYSWAMEDGQRKLFVAEFRRGPVPIHQLALSLAFDQIYAGTNVPMILQPVRADDGRGLRITLD